MAEFKKEGGRKEGRERTLLKKDAEALDGDGLHVVGGVVKLLEDGLADAAFLVRKRRGGKDGGREEG
jgi:hypothetical protein